MNLYLVFYGIFALTILIAGATTIYGMGMTLGAVIFVVGAAIFLTLYGMRWFFSEDSILSQATVKWPPVINTCPDFLTYYKRTTGTGVKEDTCIDTTGVSKKGSVMLSVFPSGNAAPPTDEKYYFSLKTSTNDITVRNKELCQRAMTYGLTWEGITNGDSCILPDGNKESSASSPGTGCAA